MGNFNVFALGQDLLFLIFSLNFLKLKTDEIPDLH